MDKSHNQKKDPCQVFKIKKEKYKAVIFGLGLPIVAKNHKQHPEIPFVPTGGFGNSAMEYAYLRFSKTPILIGFGYFGALQTNLKKGDVLIPTESIDGGTIGEFNRTKNIGKWIDQREKFMFKPDNLLVSILEEGLIQEGYTINKGKLFQVSGLRVETDQVIKELHNRGYSGIDMETATLFSEAEQGSNKAVAVMVASDNQWPPGKRDTFDASILRDSNLLVEKIIGILNKANNII